LCHISAGTGLTPAHICAWTGPTGRERRHLQAISRNHSDRVHRWWPLLEMRGAAAGMRVEDIARLARTNEERIAMAAAPVLAGR
jgi:hypothetical protein